MTDIDGFDPAVFDDLRAAFVEPPAEDVADVHIAAMVAAAAAAADPRVVQLRERKRRGVLVLCSAAGASVAILIGGGLAAASGNLPAPMQKAVSQVVDRFGIDVPDGSDDAPATRSDPEPPASEPGRSRENEAPPSVSVPEASGDPSETPPDPETSSAETSADGHGAPPEMSESPPSWIRECRATSPQCLPDKRTSREAGPVLPRASPADRATGPRYPRGRRMRTQPRPTNRVVTQSSHRNFPRDQSPFVVGQRYLVRCERYALPMQLALSR